jgi:Na+-transporting NADH:ubiquinone oxidoreductase subunit NqrF
MKKTDIKNLLRERGTPHLQHVVKPKSSDNEAKSNDYDKVVKLLNNDIFNHAAIVRQLKGEPWAGNTEATNRSLFRKKLKKMTNDEGGEYSFDEETLSDIQKILMGVSSTINHSIGRQGK